MPRKNKNQKQPTKQPAPMKWEFEPDIPTDDFLEEGGASGAGLNDTVLYFQRPDTRLKRKRFKRLTQVVFPLALMAN